MKLLPIALASALVLPVPAMAESQRGYSTERTCYKEVYREEYIPGTKDNPGRIRTWFEEKEVPCERGTRPWRNPENTTGPGPIIEEDENSCVEGSILGGIIGGGLGGVLSNQENWIWSIPTGVVGGSMIGCQIDGG